MEFLFIAALFFCNLLMVGVSLITQFVTYPSFKLIDKKEFSKFHKAYTKKMLFIVGPIMTIEFFVTVTVFFVNINLDLLIQFVLVFMIWILTFFLIVPIHKKLENQFDNKLNNKLIKLNGFRTSIWILKLFFLGVI